MIRLKELRKKRKLSQQELADLLNISRESISKYEKGEQEATYQTLKRIAKIFNVSIDYLLDTTDDNLIVISKEDLIKLKNATETINDITSKLSSGININIGDNSPSKINIGYNKNNK